MNPCWVGQGSCSTKTWKVVEAAISLARTIYSSNVVLIKSHLLREEVCQFNFNRRILWHHDKLRPFYYRPTKLHLTPEPVDVEPSLSTVPMSDL